jgi:ubiquinone/menaquinone biosynthesis C-methylase UbiE
MKNYLIDGKNESERLNFQNKMDICNLDQELSFFNFHEHHQILDAGCGNGNVIEKLIKNKLSYIDGIDFSIDRINDAKKRFENFHRVNLYQGELENTHLSGSSYDVVLCRYIFEHIMNPELVICEMRRLLKESGQIFIINFDDMVFNFHTRNEAFNKELKKIKLKVPQDLEIGRKLPQLLKKNGFKNIVWDAQTYFFKGERLTQEIENSKMRFSQGRENLSKLFASMTEYEIFVDNYLNELTDENNVLSSSKFLVKATKCKLVI